MLYTWFAIVPPVIVLGAVLITHRLIPALIVGLICAAALASDFNIFDTSHLLLQRLLLQATDLDTIYNFSFLLCIGVIISLLNATGGAAAFSRTFTKHLKTSRMVESSSLLFSLTLFIDDYLSNLTMGHVMRPLTDRFNIPRAKLAYLVHSMTGPLVILAPISSWAAMITGQLEQAGISTTQNIQIKIFTDPFFVYLKSIPFIFYSLILISSIWFIVRSRISFGPMHRHEIIAQTQKNLFGGKEPLSNPLHQGVDQLGTLSSLLVPLITLVGSVLVGIPYAGGYWLFGGTRSLLDSFKNNNQTFFVLFMAGVITLIVGFGYALWRNHIRLKQVPTIIQRGFLLMYSPIVMVFLASSLGTILRVDLQTGPYLASLLLGTISMYLLPFMFFIVSLITAITTGSAWGTIALMLPIAIPMLMTFARVQAPATLFQLPLLLPTLGAIFSGAVCGDHISPVSETTIMAASSSGAYPVDHAITQFPYAVPAIVGASCAFIVSGYYNELTPWINALFSFGLGLSVCLLILYLLNTRNRRMLHEK